MLKPKGGAVFKGLKSSLCHWLAWLTLFAGGLFLLNAGSLGAQGRGVPAARPGADRRAGPDQTLSPYFVVQGGDPETDALPLKSTRADIRIAGVVADVQVTQVYQNTGKKTLEALYVFPASTRAAVHALKMTIGPRVIEARIMERQQARQTYEQARQAGKTTSLLEQQRPNVFQMNVANILPGDEIRVQLQYLELVEPQDRVYEFVFPTVVGPRYSSQAAAGAPDTERWVKNPYLHEGEGPPFPTGIQVELQAGVPIAQLASPSHEVDLDYSGPHRVRVRVKDETTAGTKDFILRYRLAGDRIETGLLLYPGPEENFFLLMMEPPARVAPKAVLPREYIFIVDVSGSMHGFPLEVAKTLVKDMINGLKARDYLNVLLFESKSAVLFESGSLPASTENKQKALGFLSAQPGGGGTEILAALKKALGLPRTPKTSRSVVVITDGYVHVESQTFELIRQSLGEANLFAFGVGKAVNRHLIEGMARAGLGEAFVVTRPGEAAKKAARFRSYVETPVLTGIKMAFRDFSAYEAEPAAVPDLFAQRPLMVLGKYRGSPTGEIVVTGKTARGDFQKRIQVAKGIASPENSALRLLWARQRLRHLVDLSRLDRGDPRVQEVTDLGLKYGLMTPYTSFVAVDQVKRADGQVVTVKQPLPLPEGVSDLAVEGGPGRPRALKAAPPGSHWGLSLAARPREADRQEASGPVPQPGKVEVRVTRVEGVLDPEAVKKALKPALAKLAACGQAARDKGRQLPPQVTLTFSVDEKGRVTGEVQVKTGDEATTRCLARVIKGLVFPNPDEKTGQVTVTLDLQAR